ncbi:hypothetical protein PpBr36_01487 [Pyricularia pennisetigena]|uniref:hypothetical protein n=1 Tax=Pyricularia pennisetigena TaxID=1578925 RepID=UPI00114DC7B2|nr:hypothetical protein PpBr36_01487 [Pyricularia pennisetigena]TLS29403.1 hypothetical protein PpBr36_01487 [Pyricularia pennisetigena]
MPGPTRTRLACDRCHSQKLRCPKVAGSAVCTRCSRMKASCVFSPIGTATANPSASRPLRQAATDLSVPAEFSAPLFGLENSGEPWPLDSFGSGLDQEDSMQGFEWFPVDGGSGTAVPPEDSASADNGPSTLESDTTPATSIEAELSRPGHRLADLQMTLDTILAKLPTPAAYHVQKDGPLSGYLADFGARYLGDGFIENIFTSLQSLIDLYPEATAAIVTPTAADDQDPNSCEIVGCLHEVALPAELAVLEGHMGQPEPVDGTLGGQLVACHLRLLDVVDRLDRSVFMCARLEAVLPPGGKAKFHVPDLTVGKFKPPHHSAALMQLVLLKNLLDKLLFVSRELGASLDKVDAAPAVREASLSLPVLLVQAESLGKRHERTLDRFKSLVTYVIGVGFTG